jgi:hypothetical protein
MQKGKGPVDASPSVPASCSVDASALVALDEFVEHPALKPIVNSEQTQSAKRVPRILQT